MPRTLRPRLRQMLERANPNVATFVELSVRDQAKILRRQDQFLAGPTLVSMTPAVSAVASPAGALTLAATDQLLVSQYAEAGGYNIPQEDGGPTYLHTVAWQFDPAFEGCVLRSVTVRMKWDSFLHATPNVKLQIYRAAQVAGVLQHREGTSIVETLSTQISFAPLLQEPLLLKYTDLIASDVIDGSGFANVVFDLTPYRLEVRPISSPPPGPGETGQLPELYFSVTTDQQSAGNYVEWRYDTTSAQSIAGVGLVREKSWVRGDPNDPASVWVPSLTGRTMCFKLAVEQYVPTSQEVYAATLLALPGADSTGRIVFDRGDPAGTSATLELSTAGTGGPWTPVVQGDIVTPAQLAYHLRLTMNASADQRRAPVVRALGVEFRNRIDVSPESTVDPMSLEVSVPFLEPSIGEGRISLVRTGIRDYRDVGSEIASTGPDTQIEADVYLGSYHPQVTRDDWFHLTRAQVSGRVPTPTSEDLTLLSITKRLKRKIPARIESINFVHTVVGSPSPTTTQVRVSPVLSGASAGGNEYDAKQYYIRVRKSAVPELAPGAIFVISGNTGVDKLDFTANVDPTLSRELPAAFAIGDEIEVHSGVYTQPTLSWTDEDPAVVWSEIFVLRGVPDDRIGRADVGVTGRSGLPPTVSDRAPGDVVTQAKCKVSLTVAAAELGDKLIDQLSFIMGGVTTEIAGQFVYRQMYALRDASGRITVAPDPVSAVFDPRDYFGLETPTGREQRISEMACDYGVDTSSAAPLPVSTAIAADVDAIASLETQDVEGFGTDVVPAEISRWCYNSADGGRFLATQLSSQVVFATGTGLRVWPWNLVDLHPELTIGDTVVIITDQYTDYDPARKVAIRGMNAYPLTIVAASADGSRFRGFLQGLGGVTGVKLHEGDGTLQDLNTPSLALTVTPGPTSWSIGWAGVGTIEVSIDGAPFAAPGTNPLVVPLDGDPHPYKFRATGAGAPDEQTITVPALTVAAAPTAVIDRIYISATNYTTNEVTVGWAYSGSLGTGSFEILRVATPNAAPDLSNAATSLGASFGTSIIDSVPDDIITTTGPKVTYSYLVRVKNAGGTVVRTSDWLHVTYSHA